MNPTLSQPVPAPRIHPPGAGPLTQLPRSVAPPSTMTTIDSMLSSDVQRPRGPTLPPNVRVPYSTPLTIPAAPPIAAVLPKPQPQPQVQARVPIRPPSQVPHQTQHHYRLPPGRAPTPRLLPSALLAWPLISPVATQGMQSPAKTRHTASAPEPPGWGLLQGLYVPRPPEPNAAKSAAMPYMLPAAAAARESAAAGVR